MQSLIENNFEALKEGGMAQPYSLSRNIKILKPDEKVVFPDKSEIYGRDAVGPPIIGRKVIILIKVPPIGRSLMK